MADGTRFYTKQELIDAIRSLVFQNTFNLITGDGNQEALLDIVESLWDRVSDGQGLVKVDDADAIANFLGAKLTEGSNITLTVNTDGVSGEKSIEIASTSEDNQFKIDGADNSSGEFLTKITNGSGIEFTVVTDGNGDKNLTISAEQPSDLKVFYVDGNNPVDGEGSILNPYRTLDLAHTAVIGSGTAASPENDNVTIQVQGGAYTTGINLLIESVTWNFLEGSVVTFTGATDNYLFDSSVFSTTGANEAYVRGSGSFLTSVTTAGIVNAEGTATAGQSGNNYRRITMECDSVKSTGSGTSTVPLVHCKTLENSNFSSLRNDAISVLDIFSSSIGTFISARENSKLCILAEANARARFSSSNGGTIGKAFRSGASKSDLAISINNASSVIFNNITIGSVQTEDIVGISGTITEIRFTNCTFNPSSSSDSVIRVGGLILFDGDILYTGRGNDSDNAVVGVFITDCYTKTSNFASSNIIKSVNETTLPTMLIQNCFLNGGGIESGILIDREYKQSDGVVVGQNVAKGLQHAVYNVIDSNITFTGLPTSSAGLPSGSLWSNSGVITIV